MCKWRCSSLARTGRGRGKLTAGRGLGILRGSASASRRWAPKFQNRRPVQSLDVALHEEEEEDINKELVAHKEYKTANQISIDLTHPPRTSRLDDYWMKRFTARAVARALTGFLFFFSFLQTQNERETLSGTSTDFSPFHQAARDGGKIFHFFFLLLLFPSTVCY